MEHHEQDDEITSWSGQKAMAMAVASACKARQIMRAASDAEKRRLWPEP
jgi:hypothetical protein